MSKIFAIGDIHGCAAELYQMLEYIQPKFKDGDTLVTLGDYIDRGPDSRGVVKILLEHRAAHPNINHVFIKGNHEDMMLGANMRSWAYMFGRATARSYGKDVTDFQLTDIPFDHRQFFDELKTSHQIGRYVFVHAGLNPGLELSQQNPDMMIWDRSTVGYSGEYLGGYFVVYGHTPKEHVVECDNQLGIDTACVFGGKLTCAEIDLETNTYALHYVKAQQRYS